MDDVVPDRSLKRLRLDPKSLAEIVDILRRNDRRAVVKLDDVKVEDAMHADAGQLAAAKSVDIVSYWVNPDRPTWGRRHFIYLASGPGGAQYFGDSISPEVTTVLADLDTYFGRLNAPISSTDTSATQVSSPTIDNPKVILAAVIAALLISVLAFFVGRFTAEAAIDNSPLTLPESVPTPRQAIQDQSTPQPTTNAASPDMP